MAKPRRNKKIERNRWLRVVRGNVKMGNPLPGSGRWLAERDARTPVTHRADEVRGLVDDLVRPYWATLQRPEA